LCSRSVAHEREKEIERKGSPRVKPHQIITAESSPTDAKYLSPDDHAKSVTSGKI